MKDKGIEDVEVCTVCKNEQKINDCITLKQLLFYVGGASAGILFILNLIIDSRVNTALEKVVHSINELKTDIQVFNKTAPLQYITHKQFEEELDKKVDLDRIDKRTLKN